MKNIHLKKGFALVVIVLFIGVSVIPLTGSKIVEKSSLPIEETVPSFDGDILYVGGSGQGNYTSIQDAIDNASDGDTVFVYNGTYNERINMKAGVIVQGENTVTTIIDGDSGGTVVKFSNDVNTKLDGFTIRNAGFGYRAGIYCTGCSPMITNNIITSNGKGIFCGYSAAPIITNNIISNNAGAGIDCKFSATPTVTNNIVDNNFFGIYCSDSSAAIINNSVSNNEATGITCLESPSLTITNNTISGNGNVGILCYDTSALITDNEISGNKIGILFEPTIIFGPYGTEVICSDSFSEIIDNTITNNDKGIYCLYSSALIKDNEINSNNDGIYCDFLSYGWYCFAESLIYHNDFFDNTRNAYDNSYGNQWDDSSEGNYWSDFDEPGEGAYDNNSDGIVDTPYNVPGGNNQDWYPLTKPYPSTIYDGSLSGYVNDTYMNPIERARVRVYFHGTYEENYSDSSGYYHVTNIPICYCLKNATASKEGYKTEWVLLGITENTTYDFVLMPLDGYCYPVFNGTIGNNGIFITPVNVSFIFDPEIVAEIYYRIDSGGWTLYTEPFVIYEQGEVDFLWYCIDFEGNPSEECWYVLRIDYTPPAIELTVEKIGFNKWKFTASAFDEISGVNRVEFYYADELLGEVTDVPYEWIWSGKGGENATAIVYDNAGNSAQEEKPVSHSHSQSQSSNQCPQSSSNDQSIISVLPSKISEENHILVNDLVGDFNSIRKSEECGVNVTLNGTMGENGCYISDVTITITWDPDEIAAVYYRLDDGGWTLYTEPIVVSEDGVHTFEWYCVDNEGNQSSTKSVSFKIDQTAPETSCELDPSEPDGENDWYVSDVEITLTATDDTSGVNYTMYNLDGTGWTGYVIPFIVGTDGTHMVEYNSTDNAGNTESTKSVDFKIDQTLPTIELTWDEENLKLIADVYDETSGVARVEFYVNSEYIGEVTEPPYELTLPNLKMGDKIQAIVYDKAGNEAITFPVPSTRVFGIIPLTGSKIVEKPSMLTYSGDTLYVGGTGPNNYTSIQDAINAANPGDTIYVYNGSYHESVSIYKTISLIGEDKNNTIIYPSESSDSVIHISADNSYVSGFRLRNSRTRAGVWIASDNNNIANNIMFNNNKGVYMSGFKNNHISGNIFQNNNFGIYLWPGCTENTFTNNTVFSSVQGGIHVNWNSYDNVFYHNIIFDSVSTSSNNIWDNGYPSGGNYWEGYQGTDGNGDGIGDIPYHVGGGYYDRYPLGFFKPYANFTYTIDDLTVHFNGSMSTDPNPGGYLWAHNWDFGDGTQFNGNQSIISHTYSEYGTYLVSLLVIDNGGETGYVSKLVSTGNRPPDAPSNPDPSDNATEVATNMILSWSGGDPDAGDTVTYDVYFGTTNPPSKVVWNQSGNTYNPGILDFLTTYYWQIVTWDNNNASTTGSIWKFTTCNNPVYEPTNPDPYDGEIEVDLNANLSWTGGGTPGTTVTYDVYFGTTNPPPQVAWDQLETTYNPGPMDYNAHYYWQIVGRDNQGNFTSGLIWDFFTEIATFMSIIPSNIIVETDETFYVDVYIDPCEPITGANFDYLYFDPDILQANSVISHGYFPGAYPPWPYIDNVNGEIRDCYEYIMGPESVSNPGVWVTIEFTAQHQVGTSLLDIEGADCWGSSVIVNDGIVNVEAGYNSPPYEPSNPNPYDSEIYVDVDRDLSWTGGDPDPNDILTYDVYFGTSSNSPLVSSGQSSRSYDPGTMNYNTKYYWRIVSWDLFGESTSGPIWDFTTDSVNKPPYEPSNPDPYHGETNVDVDHDLNWNGGDPDIGDTVTYDVHFGTTSPPPLVAIGHSGTTFNPGTILPNTQYYWKIVAWDNHGASTPGPIWDFHYRRTNKCNCYRAF